MLPFPGLHVRLEFNVRWGTYSDVYIRETKLVLLGVPDEEDELAGAATDEEKVKKVWSIIGDDVTVRGCRRLGR